jgi:large subunit ribosomal protein L15
VVVHAHKFSQSARQKIEAAGGTVVEVPLNIERPSRSKGPNPSMRKQAAEQS